MWSHGNMVSRSAACIIYLMAFTAAVVRAESIHMANGAKLEGEIIATEGRNITIRTQQGELLVPRASLDEAWLASRHQEAETAEALAPSAEATRIKELEERISALEQQVQQLQAALRQARGEAPPAAAPVSLAAVTSQPGAVSSPPSPPPAPKAPSAPPASSISAQTGFWLSAGSGIRHNRTCRYYMKSKGGPCRQDEGRACTKCGG